MATDQALGAAAPICAGFGFRSTAGPQDFQRALAAALAAHALGADVVQAVSQPAFKPASSAEWAEALGYRVVLISRQQLEQPGLATLSHSPHVTARYPVGSIAEACSLLAAQQLYPGKDARLLGPRVSAGSATCALAISEGRA